MEKEYQVSWLKIIGITLLIAVVIAIICLVYPKKDNTMLTQQTYISNITLMKDAGFEYFSGSHLPKEIGDSERISLDEMLARNLIVEFLDEEGNSCNTQNSYIEATKTMDNEYEMSVFLSCDNKSDYIVTSISNEVVCTDCDVILPGNNEENDDNSNNTTTDTTTNSNSSNNAIKPTYTPNNSSSNSSSQNINITHNTNININYVNTCCINGDTNNCSDNCLANVYHSVIFDANGGTSVRTQTIKHGEQAIYKSTYRSGYEFLGWYLDGEEYDFSTPVTEKIVLVAKWKKKDTQPDKETHIVEFDSNGGSPVDDQEVLEGDTAIKPDDPTRDCYDFVGWYTDANLTEKYDFSTPVTSDMTLYAKWEENDTCKEIYRVKFDSNGGSSVATQRVEEGDRAVEPRDPTRSGYEFLGWYLDGRKFNFNTRIYEDITLEAQWEKDEVKYNTYCKVETETYYSISYVNANQDTWSYSWEARFENLDNVEDLTITDVGHLTTLNMYNKAYQVADDKGIIQVDENSKYDVDITSGSMLRTYSMKSSNFSVSATRPYYSKGSWYTTLSVDIKNYNNLTSYYARYLNTRIYFVPFYFEVKYTDLDNCVDDKANNSSRYDDYEIVDTYWK